MAPGIEHALSRNKIPNGVLLKKTNQRDPGLVMMKKEYSKKKRSGIREEEKKETRKQRGALTTMKNTRPILQSPGE